MSKQLYNQSNTKQSNFFYLLLKLQLKVFQDYMNKLWCFVSGLDYRLERNSSCDKFKMDILSRNKGRCTQPSATLHCLIKQMPHFRINEILVIILCSLLLLLGFPLRGVCPSALWVTQWFAQVRIFQVLFCIHLLSNAQPAHEYNGRVTKY